MPPRLLLAPAGHGKTQFVIEKIRAVLASEPLSPIIVIVPNSIQAAGFRQRLSASGGALGVDVHTFYSLYAELLARAGQPMQLLPDPLRIRLLRQVLDELCERGEIQHYATLREKPGFIALLRNVIEELKRARILPEGFLAAATDVRLHEIALIYSAYQNWLQKNNWADHEGRGWLAAIALESNQTLGADTRYLAVSGFDEFNPTQLGVLSLLAKRAKETVITLTGDIQQPQRPAHQRFRRAQMALTTSLGIQPEAMDSVSMLAPALAQIEAAIFENRKSQIVNPKSSIAFLSAQTRSAEARAALRWVKARLVRDGLKLADVAILARDLQIYRPFLEETAAEFGIPLRMMGGQALRENPAVAALLSLLALPAEDWKPRPLLDAWRSPYFDWTQPGIDAESTATLDEISRMGHISQGLVQWREAFAMWEKKKSQTNEDGDAFHDVKDDQAIKEKFESFVDLLTPPPSPATMREYVSFIESIVGDDLLPSTLGAGTEGGLNIVINARANPATAERDVAALRAFKDVLRGLILIEKTLVTDALAYQTFYADLRGAVDAATFTVPVEAGVFTASVLDGRGLSFEAVVLMGLSEGEFPKQEREDILLRESDRALLRGRGLALESKLHGDEATFFYQAITRGRQYLLLTRPYLAEDGQGWEPSPFWVEMLSLNGNPAVGRVRPEDGLNPAEAASLVEWRQAAQDFDIPIQNGIEVLNARMNPQATGIYEGDTSTRSVLDLSERFGTTHGWSASRLESYGTCAFEFFIGYALALEPRALPEDGYDVRMLGSMLHKILEDVYGGTLLTDAAQVVFASAPQEYGFRPTPLWVQQQAELLRMLEKTIAELNKFSLGYTPRVLEAKFGMGAPSLVLHTSAGEVRLHGYIDRLDAAPDGTLRVIDYKAGNAAISAAHLKEGRRLQLPIYALAARDSLGLGEISSGFYWHIQKAEASSLKLEKFEGGAPAAFETAIAQIGKHVNAIRAGHFEPKPPEDGCPSYCPAVNFCWRYKKGF